jgi:hypothetical protein
VVFPGGLRNAKIEQLWLDFVVSTAGQEDISRLEVAMHDSRIVNCNQTSDDGHY